MTFVFLTVSTAQKASSIVLNHSTCFSHYRPCLDGLSRLFVWVKGLGGFPSDPRYASSTLTAPPEEIACLGTTEYLSTSVLDCIIQCTALPPNAAHEAFPPMIGSVGCKGYISSCSYTGSLTRNDVRANAEFQANQRKGMLLRRRLARLVNPNPPIGLPQRLIIPIVNPPNMVGHFFVACFDFDVKNPNFFVAITFYDSLERAKRRIHQSSTAASIVKKVHYFFNTCVYSVLSEVRTLRSKTPHATDVCPPSAVRTIQGSSVVQCILALYRTLPARIFCLCRTSTPVPGAMYRTFASTTSLSHCLASVSYCEGTQFGYHPQYHLV